VNASPASSGPGSEAGFSLVELIVVMIISAILLSMVILSSRGNEALAKQQAMVAVATEVFTAAVAFNSDFPRVPPNSAQDPLINFTTRNAIRQRLRTGTAALPANEAAERDIGFFTRAGLPYFRRPPANPYGQQILPLRGACPAADAAAPGRVYICRPAGQPTAVRVTAFARSREGVTILVFDRTGGG
jgi:prepilin-type N-terminal cleavage/methylation domain-containing protein